MSKRSFANIGNLKPSVSFSLQTLQKLALLRSNTVTSIRCILKLDYILKDKIKLVKVYEDIELERLEDLKTLIFEKNVDPFTKIFKSYTVALDVDEVNEISEIAADSLIEQSQTEFIVEHNYVASFIVDHKFYCTLEAFANSSDYKFEISSTRDFKDQRFTQKQIVNFAHEVFDAQPLNHSDDWIYEEEADDFDYDDKFFFIKNRLEVLLELKDRCFEESKHSEKTIDLFKKLLAEHFKTLVLALRISTNEKNEEEVNSFIDDFSKKYLKPSLSKLKVDKDLYQRLMLLVK